MLYAVLDRQTSLALSSRYAHRLHEMIALRAGRTKNVERFTVVDLRARLGVPNGKLKSWDEFKRRSLETAVGEINQLSRFKVTWRVSKKYRRRVEEVELTWTVKRDLAPTKSELKRPKVGRKARRAGSVEAVAVTFPATGSVRYSQPWEGIARKHGTSPLPDLGVMGTAFRKWCAAKSIPLDGPSIEKTFAGWVKKYRV